MTFPSPAINCQFRGAGRAQVSPGGCSIPLSSACAGCNTGATWTGEATEISVSCFETLVGESGIEPPTPGPEPCKHAFLEFVGILLVFDALF